MPLIAFLGEALAISLSGVIAPGPMTAVTVRAGALHPFAGALVAVGHGLVEIPLMVALLFGLGRLLEIAEVAVAVGLAGALVLLWMGIGMVTHLLRRKTAAATGGRSPLVAGVALSAGNPYFLIWWATVGAALVSRAAAHGALGFSLFALGHWLCDLLWCGALGYLSFRGRRLLGGRFEVAVTAICAVALLFFAGRFARDAITGLLQLLGAS